MSLSITNKVRCLVRLNPIKNSILNRQAFLRRNAYSDTSRPFPPPQPTRPIDHLDDSSTTAEETTEKVMSTTFDAVADDPTLRRLYDPNTFRQSHHFDTYEVLTHLESQGFTRKQAEVIMKGIKFRLRER